MTYRATHPLYVNRRVRFQTYLDGAKEGGGGRWPVWAEDDVGNLAMSGEVIVHD